MKYDTSELCDIYHEEVNVVEPLFSNFGGRTSFGGQITTVKCFEDNGLLYDLLEENGRGRVLVIDGGGSVRRALVDAQLARLAVESEWEGLVVYGSVRQVDDLEELEIGIQAIPAVPAGAAGWAAAVLGLCLLAARASGLRPALAPLAGAGRVKPCSAR